MVAPKRVFDDLIRLLNQSVGQGMVSGLDAELMANICKDLVLKLCSPSVCRKQAGPMSEIQWSRMASESFLLRGTSCTKRVR